MAIQYSSTPLFGGAIVADIPNDFADVSSIREVPDNQEVYLARTGLASIIIEIVERVAPPDHPCTTDEEALLYHYQDIIAPGHVRDEQSTTTSPEETKLWSSNKAFVNNLPSTPAFTLLATQHPHIILAGKPDFTAILLTLIRLPEQVTDILLTINIPHASGEYQTQQIDLSAGKWGPLIESAIEARTRLLQTFNIQDWNLFAAE